MKMRPILSEIEQGAQSGLERSAKEALARARELVPVDDGDLRKSGKVVKDDLAVTVKFTAPHAWLQHERLDYEHANGGQGKYLETAALETDVAAIVAAGVRAVLGG